MCGATSAAPSLQGCEIDEEMNEEDHNAYLSHGYDVLTEKMLSKSYQVRYYTKCQQICSNLLLHIAFHLRPLFNKVAPGRSIHSLGMCPLGYTVF